MHGMMGAFPLVRFQACSTLTLCQAKNVPRDPVGGSCLKVLVSSMHSQNRPSMGDAQALPYLTPMQVAEQFECPAATHSLISLSTDLS